MVVVEQHRLFVGGLFNGISQQELEQRFSGYGEVGSVEIISRFDENGDVYKTFGYVDLKTDENNIKRCLQTYNGSKWKGHNLTIQTAKESFQQRLKREREEQQSKATVENSAKKKTKTAKERLQESFSKAGVKDFNLRNAVPGTEIMGEKNWTVTKFGRVVPIVYIRSKTKRKINKIDPSKHSHALKRLKENENDSGTNVDLLTWELDAVEDKDMYLKRIGAYHNPIKKKKIHHLTGSDVDCKGLKSTGHAYYYKYSDNEGEDNDFEVVSENFKVKVGNQDSANQNQTERRPNIRVYNSSSEDEYIQENDVSLSKVKSKQNYNCPQSNQDGEQKKTLISVTLPGVIAKQEVNNISKVISESMSTKFNSDSDKAFTQKVNFTFKNIFDENDVSSSSNGSEKNDSRETLENSSTEHKTISDAQISGYKIFAITNPIDTDDLVLNVNMDSSSKFYYQSAVNPLTKEKMEYIILEPQSTKKEHVLLPDLSNKYKNTEKQKLETKEDPVNEINDRKSKDKEVNISLPSTDLVGFKFYNDEYKVATQKEYCYANTQQGDSVRKNIKCAKPTVTNKRTVLDLDGEMKGAPDDDSVSTSSADTDEICSRNVVSIAGEISASASLGIVQFDDDNDEAEILADKKLKDHMNKLTMVSNSSETSDNISENCSEENSNENVICDALNDSNEDCNEEEEGSDDSVNDESNNYGKNDDSDVNSTQGDDSSTDEEETQELKSRHSIKPDDEDEGKSSEREDGSSDENSDEEPQELKSLHIINASNSSSLVALTFKEPKTVLDLNILRGNPEKRASSNLKRLASMQRKNEVMLDQKKAIQKALAAVDSKEGPAQGRHIVFDSDEDEENKTVHVAFHTTKLSELKQINKGPSLFASDDEDSEDEDDDSRFQIKPQFEGKSGEKLRKLQETIGGDSRFTMDKRFLEEQSGDDIEQKGDDKDADNEVDLENEKEKSLSILKGIVGSKGVLTRSKDVQVEKFGFLGKMIRYDPSRDDHSHYEVKNKAKESSLIIQEKSTKTNKVELTQDTVPEVSKEKYFEVSSNIRKAFGSEQNTAVEGNEGQQTGKCSTQKDSTFRFFGDSDDDQDAIKSANNDIMQSEALSKDNAFDGSKFKFFESSDEEMEDEVKDNLPMKSDEIDDVEKRLCFFFKLNDQRLTDGPLQFYQKEDINNIKQKWQEKRSKLMMLSRNRYRKANRQKRQTAQQMKKHL